MIFYYITNKDNAQLIKNEGLLECKRPLSLISQYNNNDIDLSTHEILKICIKDIKYLKLNKNYNLTNIKDLDELKSIIMYLTLNSNKNCLVNNNEYIFFSNYTYFIL